MEDSPERGVKKARSCWQEKEGGGEGEGKEEEFALLRHL